MTTLRKLRSQCIRLLNAGNKTRDTQLNDKYIQEEILQVTNSLIKAEWFALKNMGESGVPAYSIATYSSVAVLEDSNSGRCYVTLPAQPANLPGGEGIQVVKPQTGNRGKDRAMIPLLPSEVEVFGQLLTGSEIFKDQYCFEQDRNKIWFTEKDEKTLLEDNIDEVEIRMVIVDPSQTSEDAQYPVPPEMEIEIIKQVLQLHGYTAKEVHDLINDGVETK